MLLSLAMLAATMPMSVAPTAVPAAASVAAPAVPSSDITASALRWLALVDGGQWQASWDGTSSAFRKLNTVKAWTAASERARVPLGNVVSRSALGEESVPAPPAGITVVKFRTTFANKADVIETVSLVREDAVWKVVGIYLQ